VSRRGKDIDSYLGGRSGPRGKRKISVKKVTRHPEEGREPKYDVIKIDLHEHALHRAEKAIKEKIGELISGNFCIEFCHGHNSGTQIRDFIRDGRLDQFITSKKFKVDIWYKDKGNTFVESR
jgi:hypothetical protein